MICPRSWRPPWAGSCARPGAIAVPLLSAAQARRPQDFWLNFELGVALFESGRSEESLGFYRAALAVRPEASPAHNGVGVTSMPWAVRTKRSATCSKPLRIDPNFAIAHGNLGWALSQGPDRRGDRALRGGHPARPEVGGCAHINLGVALDAKGRPDEAIDHYQEAIRLDPKFGPGPQQPRPGPRAKGRPDEAIDHYEEVRPARPASVRPGPHQPRRGSVRRRAGSTRPSSHFQEAVRFDPKLALAADSLFTCRYAAACAAVQAAAGLDSRDERLGERSEPTCAGEPWTGCGRTWN